MPPKKVTSNINKNSLPNISKKDVKMPSINNGNNNSTSLSNSTKQVSKTDKLPEIKNISPKKIDEEAQIQEKIIALKKAEEEAIHNKILADEEKARKLQEEEEKRIKGNGNFSF